MFGYHFSAATGFVQQPMVLFNGTERKLWNLFWLLCGHCSQKGMDETTSSSLSLVFGILGKKVYFVKSIRLDFFFFLFFNVLTPGNGSDHLFL